MSRQERERKARQTARRAAASGGEGGGGPSGGSQGDAPSAKPRKIALFQPNPSPGEIAKDARLVGRAIRGRWPVDPEKMGEVVNGILESLAACKPGEKKERAALARVLVQMVGQNQRDDLSEIEPPEAPITEGLVKQLLAGISGDNDDPAANQAVYGMANPAPAVVLAGGDGDGVGAR